MEVPLVPSRISRLIPSVAGCISLRDADMDIIGLVSVPFQFWENPDEESSAPVWREMTRSTWLAAIADRPMLIAAPIKVSRLVKKFINERN